jgi:hypothetical protein
MKRGAGTKRSWRKWVTVVAVLGVVVALGVVADDPHESGGATPSASAPSARPRQPSNDPPAGEAAVALLGGLRPNDEIAGWKVKSITLATDADVKNAIAVWLEKSGRSFVVWIAVKARLEHHPAVETKGFALYFGRFEPPTQDMEDDEVRPALDAIAERVRDNESKTSAAGLL